MPMFRLKRRGCVGAPASPRHRDSYDEMASALLDSSPSPSQHENDFDIAGVPYHELPQTSNATQYPQSRATSDSVSRKKSFMLMAVPKVARKRSAQLHKASSTHRVAKRSSPSPLKSPKTRGRGSPSKKHSSLHMSSEESARLQAPAGLPSTNLLSTGSVAPGQLKTRHFTAAQASEINEKVNQILAANAAIAAERARPRQRSVLSRIKSHKALSRVSTVFTGRKGNGQGSKPQAHGGVMEPTMHANVRPALAKPQRVSSSEDDVGAGSASTSAPHQHSSVSDAELRENEGKNLDRYKVKDRVGRDFKIQRKPVPSRGPVMHSSGTQTTPSLGLEDPFSDGPNDIPSSHQSEVRQKEASQAPEAHGRAPTGTDPFRDERIMDMGVDTELSSPPFASSTPRSRLVDSRAAALGSVKAQQVLKSLRAAPPVLPCPRESPNGESPTKKATQSSARPGEMSLDGSQNPLPGGISRQEFLYGGNMHPSQGRAFSGLRSMAMLQPFQRFLKKHPSPSRAQLEDLACALDMFEECRLFGSSDTIEEDELALDPEHGTAQTAANVLAPRDQNRQGGRRTGRGNQGPKDPKTERSKFPTRAAAAASRLPRARQGLRRPLPQSASPLQLLAAESTYLEDLDELQWDNEENKFGRAI